MNITAETPVDDVLNSRPQLIRLAQEVFGRHTPGTVRAFSQFRSLTDLASVIEAKRKGVFDYGQLIIDTDTGVQWPRDTKAILTAIDKAADGKADKIDWSSLGDYGDDVAGKALFGKSASAPTRKAEAPAPTPKPSGQKAEKVCSLDGCDNKLKSRGLCSRHYNEMRAKEKAAEQAQKANEQTSAPQPEEPRSKGFAPAAPSIDGEVVYTANTAVLERIDKLSIGLADAFETVLKEVKNIDLKRASVVEDEIGYVKNEVENVKAGLIGVASYLDVVNTNLQKIGEYLDPFIEYAERPAVVDTLMQLSVPEDLEERMSPEVAGAHESERRQIAEKTSVTVPMSEPLEPEIQDAIDSAQDPEPDEEPEVVSYTREELQAMDLSDLRDEAERLGVPNAQNIPYKTSLVNKIIRLAQ